MTALLAGVLTASLLGSTHCVGMCGAFLALAIGRPGESRLPAWRMQGAYHLGRLLTYTAAGAAAGGLGAVLDAGGTLVGLQRAATLLAGATMIAFGGIAALRAAGVRIPGAPVPRAWQETLRAAHRAAAGLPPSVRALSIGLLTTLLPCGWLYAFVITAAGTGAPLLGAATMAVFWAGTLPLLAALGTGLQCATGPLRRHLPIATAVLLVAVGVFTVSHRAGAAERIAALTPHAPGAPSPEHVPACCAGEPRP